MSIKIYEWLKKHLPMLFNQRGEAGDDDDDQDPDGSTSAGDGNAGDDDQTGAGDDDDHPGSGSDDGDDDGQHDDPITSMRQEISELKTIISELKGTGKRTQEGDDNAGSGGRQTPSPAQSEADKARLAKVEYDDPKHPFHGKTLGEIYKMNPREAFAIDPYLATQIQNDESYKASQEQTRQQEAVAQAEREEKEFAEEYAKLTFNDRPYDQLKPEEQAQVEAMIDKVEDWMIANHKFGITVQEAYIIMDHKNLLAKTSSNASRKVIDAATRGGVRTVSSKSDGGGNNAGGDMSKWTDDQMMKHIDGLDTDAKFNDFMAKAPDSVRKAFPSLPWTPKA